MCTSELKQRSSDEWICVTRLTCALLKVHRSVLTQEEWQESCWSKISKRFQTQTRLTNPVLICDRQQAQLIRARASSPHESSLLQDSWRIAFFFFFSKKRKKTKQKHRHEMSIAYQLVCSDFFLCVTSQYSIYSEWFFNSYPPLVVQCNTLETIRYSRF